MALHKYFQDEASREFFEAAFYEWYERTRNDLDGLRGAKEVLQVASGNLELASAKLPINEEGYRPLVHAKNNAISRVDGVSEGTVKIAQAIEALAPEKPSKSEALATILRVRAKISRAVGALSEETEKFYGSGSAFVQTNTKMHLNGVAPKDQAVLFEYFNLVQELSKDAPDIIVLAEKIAEREARAKVIGPHLPDAALDTQRASLG